MLRKRNVSVRKSRLHQKSCGEVATAKLCQMQLFLMILNYFNLFITDLKFILSGRAYFIWLYYSKLICIKSLSIPKQLSCFFLTGVWMCRNKCITFVMNKWGKRGNQTFFGKMDKCWRHQAGTVNSSSANSFFFWPCPNHINTYFPTCAPWV